MSIGVSLRNLLKSAGNGLFSIGASDVVGNTRENGIERYSFGIEVTHLRIILPNLPHAFDGLTIAQISDLHMGEWMTLPRLLSVVKQVNALRPDIVAVTGDFVGAMKSTTSDDLTTGLRKLTPREGAFGVLGNHDHHTNAPAIRRALRASGTVRLLSNEHVVIERDGERLYIAGIDDLLKGYPDLTASLNGIPRGAAVVLLAHEPDIADEVARTERVGLQLSGHTHGGQVRLPGVGALLLPELGKKFPMGFYSVDNLALYVNRGVGMVGLYVRLNCRPEITHITLSAT